MCMTLSSESVSSPLSNSLTFFLLPSGVPDSEPTSACPCSRVDLRQIHLDECAFSPSDSPYHYHSAFVLTLMWSQIDVNKIAIDRVALPALSVYR
jgi:hypothetical protein